MGWGGKNSSRYLHSGKKYHISRNGGRHKEWSIKDFIRAIDQIVKWAFFFTPFVRKVWALESFDWVWNLPIKSNSFYKLKSIHPSNVKYIYGLETFCKILILLLISCSYLQRKTYVYSLNTLNMTYPLLRDFLFTFLYLNAMF